MVISNTTDIVILAGGFGERLWPASKPDYPKQFMSLSEGFSFIQTSIIRALAVKPTGKILIITRSDLLTPTTEHCNSLLPNLSKEDKEKVLNDLIIIAEPCPRHTTAPLLLACYLLELLDKKKHTLLVLASDHVIKPIEKFVADCNIAFECAEKEKFVCFAIPPRDPNTGYGYIKAGIQFDEEGSVFQIDQFKEKPNLETAVQYLAEGSYWWNSGMFSFTSSFFINELYSYNPDFKQSFACLDNAAPPDFEKINGIKVLQNWDRMNKAYSTVRPVAVDVSVAEKTRNAVVVKATFDWDDVGSWDAFEKLFTSNNGKVVEIESNNNFVYSDIPVALCNIDDVVVVIKNGKALVMKKGSSSLVRDAVKQMKELNDE